ncbi:MAG: cellulose synthase family protein [Methanobacteriota archaeon]
MSLALFAYAANWYHLTYRWLRLRRARPASTTAPSSIPLVTVQIPVYNERYVVRRLLSAVAAFDWPRERFEIQVLDDSDDDTTGIVREVVERLRPGGLRVLHLRRVGRDGFKAGALAAGLREASGEFVAIFDCDFVPPPEFLRRVMPSFEDARVGFVQARWSHLNRDFSLLTAAQALGIDGHFAVEQEARSRSGLFMNFNGTAGVWRKACIQDAGGWHGDTIAEDLDLSYRAQLRGWRGVYAKDVECPAELPVQLHAFKRQQFRWARGSFQVFLKLRRAIARSPLRPWQRLQAYLHLSLYAVHPLMLASFLLLAPLVLSGALHPLVPAGFATASLGPASMYVASQLEFSPNEWRRGLLLLPFLTALGMGQSLNNSRAVLGAILRRPSAFLRTPKFGIEGRAGSWRRSRYALGGNRQTLAELALAGYGIGATGLAIASGNPWSALWLGLFTAGFVLVGALSLCQVAPRRRTPTGGSDDATVA